MSPTFGRPGHLVFLVAILAAGISSATDTHVRWWKTGDVRLLTEPFAPSNAGSFSTTGPIADPAGAAPLTTGTGGHSSWGTWTGAFTRPHVGDTITSTNPGDWFQGIRTPSANLPASGTKTFTGMVYGSVRDVDNGGASTIRRLTGTFSLTVDFSAGRVTGQINNLARITGPSSTSDWISGIDIDAKIDGLGDGDFDSFPAGYNGLSKSGFTSDLIGGFIQGFLFGPNIEEMAAEWELGDTTSPDGQTRAQGILVSDPVINREPRLFGIMIGQNEETTGGHIRGNKDTAALFDLLSLQASWAPTNEGNPSNPIEFNRNIQSGSSSHLEGVDDLIRDQLDGMQVRMGDTLIFYFHGHGGYVTRDLDPDPGKEDPDDESDTRDEFLACGLNDDDLYKIFSEPKWAGVRKIFFLDTCHSGGFLGTSASDVGDIEKLRHFAFFASATEEGTSYSVPATTQNGGPDPDAGMGILTRDVLLPALAFQNGDISGDGLVDYFNANVETKVQKYVGAWCPLNELYAPGSTAVFEGLDMVYGSSPDFDMSASLVPKPPVVGQSPNAALKKALANKIKKLKKKAKKAKRKKRYDLARRLVRKIKVLQRRLRSL